MYTKVVLLTGNELRHEFFRKYISSDPDINVLNSYCESEKGNLTEIVRSEAKNNFRLRHLEVRQQTESDFFGLFCNKIKDNSNPIFIAKGEINESILVDKICELNPDIIISYGCSIIKSNLLIFSPVNGSNSAIASISSSKNDNCQARSSKWDGKISILSPLTRNAPR